MMSKKGSVWKFSDNISTDLIVPNKYIHLRSNLLELTKHVLEVANPDFPVKVKEGDFIVGGKNFGLGSSREQAPVIIKMAGVSAVLAKSFARIFYRNSINVGLPLLICDTSQIEEGDHLTVDFASGKVIIAEKNLELQAEALPDVALRILNDGGLIAHVEKYGGFNIN